MPRAQRQTAASVAPAPKVSAGTLPALRPRTRVQAAWMSVAILAAFVVALMGVTYLSGRAQVARETNRGAMLQKMTKLEVELLRIASANHAKKINPNTIEKEAKRRGMRRIENRETITVGAQNPGSVTK